MVLVVIIVWKRNKEINENETIIVCCLLEISDELYTQMLRSMKRVDKKKHALKIFSFI